MTSCSCDADDGPTVYRTSTPTARRAHRCDECKGVIQPGERYTTAFGIWEDGGATFKTCGDCTGLMQWAKAHVPCICWAHGLIHQSVIDAAAEWDSECPGLLAEARAKIRAIREKRRQARAEIEA